MNGWQRLAGLRSAAADEEDVALSAFDCFCEDARQGHYPQLNDRDDLWKQLLTIIGQKAIDLHRRENALKRGGQKTRVGEAELQQVISQEPTPEFAAQFAERSCA